MQRKILCFIITLFTLLGCPNDEGNSNNTNSPSCTKLDSVCETCTDNLTQSACKTTANNRIDESCSLVIGEYEKLCNFQSSPQGTSCRGLESVCQACSDSTTQIACQFAVDTGIEETCTRVLDEYKALCGVDDPNNSSCTELSILCETCSDATKRSACLQTVNADIDDVCESSLEFYADQCRAPNSFVVSGTVTNAVGAVEGAKIILEPADGTAPRATHSGSNGGYVFSGLSAGTFILKAEKSNNDVELYLSFEKSLSIKNADREVAIKLTAKEISPQNIEVDVDGVTWFDAYANSGEVIQEERVYHIEGDSRSEIPGTVSDGFRTQRRLTIKTFGNLIPWFGESTNSHEFEVCIINIDGVEKCNRSVSLKPFLVDTFLSDDELSSRIEPVAYPGDTVSYSDLDTNFNETTVRYVWICVTLGNSTSGATSQGVFLGDITVTTKYPQALTDSGYRESTLRAPYGQISCGQDTIVLRDTDVPHDIEWYFETDSVRIPETGTMRIRIVQ